jgi:hypothetical protein
MSPVERFIATIPFRHLSAFSVGWNILQLLTFEVKRDFRAANSKRHLH